MTHAAGHLRPGHWRCKACGKPNGKEFSACQLCKTPRRRPPRRYNGSIEEARMMLAIGATLQQIEYSLRIPHATLWRLKQAMIREGMEVRKQPRGQALESVPSPDRQNPSGQSSGSTPTLLGRKAS